VLGRVPRPLPAAPRRYLVMVPGPLPVASLFVRIRYLAVVLRLLPEAPQVARCKTLVVAPRPLPAAPRRFFITLPIRFPRRRSLRAAGS
jgi:hypothetical protein